MPFIILACSKSIMDPGLFLATPLVIPSLRSSACSASLRQWANSGGTGEENASAVFATPDMREDVVSGESGGQSSSSHSISKQALALLVWPLCFVSKCLLSLPSHSSYRNNSRLCTDLCNTCPSWGLQSLLMSNSSLKEPWVHLWKAWI